MQDNESKVMKHILGYTDLQCQECGEEYTIGPTTEPPEDGLCESCRHRQKEKHIALVFGEESAACGEASAITTLMQMDGSKSAFGCVPKASPAKPIIAHAPERCDICHGMLRFGPTYFDGATQMGPWAWMCSRCHGEVGRGLGTGKGQEYNSVNNEKVRG